MRNRAKKDELQKAAAEAGALPENLHFTQLDVTNDESVASAIGTTPCLLKKSFLFFYGNIKT